MITVDEQVDLLNQEGQTQTHRSTRQISKETGLTQCTGHSPRSWSGVSFSFEKRLLPSAMVLGAYSIASYTRYCIATQLRCGGMFNNHVIANFP